MFADRKYATKAATQGNTPLISPRSLPIRRQNRRTDQIPAFVEVVIDKGLKGQLANVRAIAGWVCSLESESATWDSRVSLLFPAKVGSLAKTIVGVELAIALLLKTFWFTDKASLGLIWA